jgi:hypothetical protein
MDTQLMNEERYIEHLPIVAGKNANSSACCWINPMKASPTTAKDSAVLTSFFVMEVSSIMKGGMGFVGLTNSEKKASSISTSNQSKMTAANLMILSLCQLLPVVSTSKTT